MENRITHHTEGSFSFTVESDYFSGLYEALQPLWFLLCNPADELQLEAYLPQPSDYKITPVEDVPVGMVTFVQSQKVRLARQRLRMKVPPEQWQKE